MQIERALLPLLSQKDNNYAELVFCTRPISKDEKTKNTAIPPDNIEVKTIALLAPYAPNVVTQRTPPKFQRKKKQLLAIRFDRVFLNIKKGSAK